MLFPQLIAYWKYYLWDISLPPPPLQAWTLSETHLYLGWQEYSLSKWDPSTLLTLKLLGRQKILWAWSSDSWDQGHVCRILGDKLFFLFKSGALIKVTRLDLVMISLLYSLSCPPAMLSSLYQSCPQESHLKQSFFPLVKILSVLEVFTSYLFLTLIFPPSI